MRIHQLHQRGWEPHPHQHRFIHSHLSYEGTPLWRVSLLLPSRSGVRGLNLEMMEGPLDLY